MSRLLTPDETFLLWERIAIKLDSGIPLEQAQAQAQAELFDSRQMAFEVNK